MSDKKAAKSQETMDNLVNPETLASCECHVGLYTKYWNPKMKPFIEGRQGGRYVFDKEKSCLFLKVAYQYIMDLVSADADILLVGVKNKNTAPIITEAAKRVKTFYLTQRWLGGLLTNFKTISLNIKKLNHLDTLLQDEGQQEGYTKKRVGSYEQRKKQTRKILWRDKKSTEDT